MGVSLNLKNGIAYINRNDLEYFDCEMESVFIEIDCTVFGTKSNIIIGVICRMPDSSVDVFDKRICDILNVVTKEKKMCYLVGDLNIDLLKHEEHRPSSDFVDILYANNMFPLIVKPTRVTDKSATLIDHIMTNNFDIYSRHKQGILMSSISDHYALFHIAGNVQFQLSISNLSPAMKESIKVKNKLYININKRDNKEDKLAFYKLYRNKLNHILRITERKYYQDLLSEHKVQM